ncbi:MAG: EcsC family protein [Ignavibacteriales bacterium]|nr:EcsC family protein [Ignavibacteriales bacterium]
MKISQDDRNTLEKAVNILENPSLIAQIADFIAIPIEAGLKNLPDKVTSKILKLTNKALLTALKGGILTMDSSYRGLSSNNWHKTAIIASGAAGGFFGLPGLSIELPLSTSIILRSIADIARGEGEILSKPEVQLECLQVFGLGGKSDKDDSSESGYYTIRVGLAKSLGEAAKRISGKTFAEKGAPALISFITKIANRFGVQVTEKTFTQSIPVFGAITGGAINFIFIHFYQQIAWGHFTVRRLERKYGAEYIKEEYHKIKQEMNEQPTGGSGKNSGKGNSKKGKKV